MAAENLPKPMVHSNYKLSKLPCSYNNEIWKHLKDSIIHTAINTFGTNPESNRNDRFGG